MKLFHFSLHRSCLKSQIFLFFRDSYKWVWKRLSLAFFYSLSFIELQTCQVSSVECMFMMRWYFPAVDIIIKAMKLTLLADFFFFLTILVSVVLISSHSCISFPSLPLIQTRFSIWKLNHHPSMQNKYLQSFAHICSHIYPLQAIRSNVWWEKQKMWLRKFPRNFS